MNTCDEHWSSQSSLQPDRLFTSPLRFSFSLRCRHTSCSSKLSLLRTFHLHHFCSNSISLLSVNPLNLSHPSKVNPSWTSPEKSFPFIVTYKDTCFLVFASKMNTWALHCLALLSIMHVLLSSQ